MVDSARNRRRHAKRSALRLMVRALLLAAPSFCAERVVAQELNTISNYAFIDTLSIVTPEPLTMRSERNRPDIEHSGLHVSGWLKPWTIRSIRSRPRREYTGAPVAGWLLYSSLRVSAAYDDNLYQSTLNRVSAAGVRFRPRLIAERDSGIHHTTLYALGDITLFPGVPFGDVVNARFGGTHLWEPYRDLTFRGSAEYGTYTSLITSFPIDGTPSSSAQRFSRSNVSLSGIKFFNRAFVGVGSMATATIFEPLATTFGDRSQSIRNNVLSSTTARLGYFVTPRLYAFVESLGSFRLFNDPSSNSEGYRVVGGVGTGRISLFIGELFAGYQRRFYHQTPQRSPGAAVYGGKLFWYPSRAWTIGASLDQTFEDSGVPTLGNPAGGAVRATTLQVNATYAVSRNWSVSGHARYQKLAFVDSGLRSEVRNVGAQVNYRISRNVGAHLDYDFDTVLSNTQQGNFRRNQVALGLDIRF